MEIEVKKEGSWYNCIIDKTRIRFCTKSFGEIERKANAMVTMYNEFIKDYPEYKE